MSSSSSSGESPPVRKRWKGNENIPVPFSTQYRHENVKISDSSDSDENNESFREEEIGDSNSEEENAAVVDEEIEVTTQSEEWRKGEENNDLSENPERDDSSENTESEDSSESGESFTSDNLNGSEDDEVESSLDHQEGDDDCNVPEISLGISGFSSDISDSDEELIDTDQLYQNSNLTVDQAVYYLLNLFIGKNKSKEEFKETLDTVKRFLPKDNKLPKSLHKLLVYLEQSTASESLKVIRHKYCPKCNSSFDFDKEKCNTPRCQNEKFCVFFEIDIRDQIKNLFEKFNLWEKTVPFVLNKDSDMISDVTTGSEYIRVNSRENRGPHDLTLLLNSDGLSVIKSNKSHCWPVMLSICELPLHLRESCLIFAGLWFDRKIKPPMNIFLQPIVDKLKDAYIRGISWVNNKTQEIIISRIVVPGVIADGPARATLQNITNFNGKRGCNLCEFKTTSIKLDEKSKKQAAYVFVEGDDIVLRVGAKMIKQAEKAVKSNKRIKGVKGHSVLSDLPFLDLGVCMIIDAMHFLLLGIVRQLLNLWFFQKGPWNISKHMKDINKLLAEIRPFSQVTRAPRSIDLSKFFKASEYLFWLLYYSVPIVASFLPTEYFQHFLLLQSSVFALFQSEISLKELGEIEKNLRMFVVQISLFYGPLHATYNMHQLLHLPCVVKRWGLPWATWAFCFESFNNFIGSCAHGTKLIGVEIMNRIILSYKFNIMKCRIENQSKIKHDHIEIGKKKDHSFNEVEMALIGKMNINLENSEVFKKMKIHGKIFSSRLSKRIKFNDYTVEIAKKDKEEIIYGEIVYFLKSDGNLFLLINPFSLQSSGFFVHEEFGVKSNHIPIQKSNNLLLIPYSEIKTLKHTMKVGNYVCKPTVTFIKKSL